MKNKKITGVHRDIISFNSMGVHRNIISFISHNVAFAKHCDLTVQNMSNFYVNSDFFNIFRLVFANICEFIRLNPILKPMG